MMDRGERLQGLRYLVTCAQTKFGASAAAALRDAAAMCETGRPPDEAFCGVSVQDLEAGRAPDEILSLWEGFKAKAGRRPKALDRATD